ncbi:MAG: triose-phosphate isomerase [Dehalococcoidales bacterium]|nr:triose-phosphate isomerase [Dehalococcoidales bacterium]
MRIPLIAGNWKMNKTVDESIALVTGIVKPLEDIKGVEILICPPFTSLHTLADLLKNSSIKLGAQNMHYEDKGAFTGEVSPLMIKDLCQYVIIGHSERRQYFNDDEYANKKIKAAINFGIVPILCIGEKLEENMSGKTIEVLERQLEQAFNDIHNIGDIVIAYEPIWAIGSGKTATGEQANNTIGVIRQKISSLYENKTASNVRILYGGSVTADNITEFVQQPEIDGALVGGASLKPEIFRHIASQTSRIASQSRNGC